MASFLIIPLYRALFLSPVDEVLRTLGEGTFGKVVCCKDK